MEIVDNPVPQHDQLGFFLFIAFTLHLMLILGVGFTALPEANSTPQLEVTLAQYASKRSPEDARFIAQANQEGSGTLSERAEITTRRRAEFSDNRIRELGAAARPDKPRPRWQEQSPVSTVTDTVYQVPQNREMPEPQPL